MQAAKKTGGIRCNAHKLVGVTGLFLATGLLLGSAPGKAATIYFNDLNRGPADVLDFDGLTVACLPSGLALGAGQPTTVQGEGLGLDDGFGRASEAEERAHFAAGNSEAYLLSGGAGFIFHVEGWINSITLLPVIRSFSGADSVLPLPEDTLLEFSLYEVGQFRGWPVVPANASGSVTIHSQSLAGGASTWVLTPQPNHNPSIWFSSCRSDYLTEEQTIQWGFTVISLDYTPAPEPGPSALLVMGIIGLACARRKWLARQ